MLVVQSVLQRLKAIDLLSIHDAFNSAECRSYFKNNEHLAPLNVARTLKIMSI
jgi:hypothetical protein